MFSYEINNEGSNFVKVNLPFPLIILNSEIRVNRHKEVG